MNCIYSQLKTCSSREVTATIEGVLHHCTKMKVEKLMNHEMLLKIGIMPMDLSLWMKMMKTDTPPTHSLAIHKTPPL